MNGAQIRLDEPPEMAEVAVENDAASRGGSLWKYIVMQNPVVLLIRALGLWLAGRVRLAKQPASQRVEGFGEVFEPFRKVVVDSREKPPQQPGAIFRVRFKFKSFSATANRRLSLIPTPLIVAQPGFRSKIWFLGQKSGDFMGLYEFETLEQARAYWHSLPLRIMRRRAKPSSLSYEVREVGTPSKQDLRGASALQAPGLVEYTVREENK